MTDYREKARAQLKLESLRELTMHLQLPFSVAPGDLKAAYADVHDRIIKPWLAKLDEAWAANDKWSTSCDGIQRELDEAIGKIGALEDRILELEQGQDRSQVA